MNMKDSKKKNRKLEALRFFGAVSISLTHLRLYSDDLPFGGLYLGVDLFLLLSGYFLYKAWEKRKDGRVFRETFQYGKRRYLRLLGPFLAAFVISFLVKAFCLKEPVFESIGAYLREAFMIEFFVMPIEFRANPPGWYCGYLVIASMVVFLILYIFRKTKMSVQLGFFFGTGCLLYLVLSIKNHCLNLYPRYAGVFELQTFGRMLAGLLLGCGCQVAERLGFVGRIAKLRTGIKGKCMDLMSFAVGLYWLYMTYWDHAYRKEDFIIVFLMVYLFLFVFLQPEKDRALFDKLAVFGGKISMDIYLLHYAIARVFADLSLFSQADWKVVSLLYLVIVIGVAVIYHICYDKIGAIGKRIVILCRKKR